MTDSGLEIYECRTYQTFQDDTYQYYFSIEEVISDEYDNKGDGDIHYQLKTTYLNELEYRWHMDDEYMETFNHQDIFDLCNSIYDECEKI